MKYILTILFLLNCIFGAKAQNNESYERYKLIYDSLKIVIQNDSSFFNDLQNKTYLNDSEIAALKIAITQPFDSIGKIITTSYLEVDEKSENLALVIKQKEGDPIDILKKLIEYKSIVDAERNYQSGATAQKNESYEKYIVIYDSLKNVIQNDSSFFIDLQNIIEIKDSSINKMKIALTQPFDSIGKIIKTSYLHIDDEGGEIILKEKEGDPIEILKKLIEYKSIIDKERNYKSEINQYFENLKNKNRSVTKKDLRGTYLKVDTLSYSVIDSDTIPDIDSTILIIRKKNKFCYIWSPIWGPENRSHIKTNGHWSFNGRKLILNSEYQENEWRFFEEYKAEYGDSITKIYVQTYDNLIGFFEFQSIGVFLDTMKDYSMTFADKEFPKQRCVVTFNLPRVDSIIFYGRFGRMPIIEPKNKKSNHFVLQYNLSTNWDYQYMKNIEWDFKGDEVSIILNWGERLILKKIKE